MPAPPKPVTLSSRLTLLAIATGALLALVLGWHAFNAWRMQERILASAMHDYALLAGNRFAQNAIYGLYVRLSALNAIGIDAHGRSPADIVAELEAALRNPASPVHELNPLARRAFVSLQRSGETWWSGRSEPDGGFIAVLEAAMGPMAEASRPSLFVDPYGGGNIYYGSPLRGPAESAGVLGVELERQAVVDALWTALDRPLLPGLMDARFDNGSFATEIRDPQGQVLKSTVPGPGGATAAKVPFAAIYDGLLPGYSVRMSLDPGTAHYLLHSRPGPERPWLLLIFLVALLTALGLSLFLVRRQHQLAELRERFVAQVSHELRTPLTQIRMYAETLRLGRARGAGERDHALRVIDREARRLGRLVDNVLSFSGSKQATGAGSPTDLELVSAANEQVRQFRELYGNFDASVNAGEAGEIWVRFDPDILQQVLYNMLDNARKYGGEEVRVQLCMSGAPRPTLRIEDDGPGIPPAERGRIWLPFYRPEREARNGTSGSGIGLALVRTLMEASGGSIRLLDSTRGARFELVFPEARRP